METDNMVDITGADMSTLIKKAYDLSKPQGLGFIHFQEGPIPQDVLDTILEKYNANINEPYDQWESAVLYMDYVLGRAVKLSVFRKEDKLYIRKDWYYHSADDLIELLNHILPTQQPTT